MRTESAIGLALLALTGCTGKQAKQPASQPNIIYILADDLGYGDLSCMGQTHFRTPNIDRLASQGMLMTRHYAGTSVSAPSRSCLITGQHTGHTPIRGNKEFPVEGQQPLPADCYNIFRYLQGNGYTTGVYGKWGLGAPGTEGVPEKQGVDDFYGYNCQRLAHNYYPDHLWHNGERIELPGNQGHDEGQYAPYLYHEKALDFVRDNAGEGHPFFMFYATVIPHAELRLPGNEIDACEGDFLPEHNFEGCDDGPMYKKGGYGSQPRAHAAFGAMITLLDRQVGEIADLVDSLGIADNTIIIFTSDNGPHAEGGAQPGFFNSAAGLRGIKRDLYEGGIRVPFIARWTGHITPGTTSSHVAAFWDFFPTVADLVGKPIPESAAIDGISYLPALLGDKNQKEHDYLYWEFHEINGRQAVLKGDWKAVRYNVSTGGQIQLYNLADDPAESNDLAAEYPGKVAEFEKIMSEARIDSEIFQFASPTFKGQD
ncbi:MAG: arylsulfatase [Candidatus Cryptobacteroides sp.]